MLLNAFIYFFVIFVVAFHQKICVFIILISFFDGVSNLRNRILTNQKRELVVSNFQWNCMYKIQSSNLNLNYPNILTNQIDFCFPKLYFSPLIRTKMEFINK